MTDENPGVESPPPAPPPASPTASPPAPPPASPQAFEDNSFGAWVPMHPPVPPRRARRRWLVALAVAGVLIVAVGAAGAYVLTRPSGPSYPKQWDARVLDYVHFVEQDRHHTFKHPIAVDFLSDADFKKKVTTPESKLSKQDKKDLESFTALFRALGLVSAGFDPLKATNDLLGGAVVGLYDDKTKRIYVRGQDVSLVARPTLVHELTHALQDQYFDLEKKDKQLEKDKAEASDAFQAVVEGDAVRVENDYRESLSKADQAQLAKDEATQGDQANKDIADVPKIMQASLGFPYAAGSALMALQQARTGVDSIDDLFVHPPVSTEQLLDPWRLFVGDQPQPVPTPTLSTNEKHLDDGTFGALGWYLVLSDRIDTKQALHAIDGWRGDSYVTFSRAGRSCVKVDYLGDTSADASRLKSAVDAWIAAGPQGAASDEQHGSGVTLTTCAVDRRVTSRNASDDAIALAVVRVQLAAEFLREGADQSEAKCAARKLVDEFDLKVLQSSEVPADVRNKVIAIIQSC